LNLVKEICLTDGPLAEPEAELRDDEVNLDLSNWTKTPLLSALFMPDTHLPEELQNDGYISRRNDAVSSATQVVVGGALVILAMDLMDMLMFRDQYYQSNVQKACDLYQNNWCYWAGWPTSITDAIGQEHSGSLVSIVVSGLFIGAAMMCLSSKMGRPDLHPRPVGLIETLFTYLRWFLPMWTLLLVPFTPGVTPASDALAFQSNLHTIYAIIGFGGTPTLELIATTMSCLRFFGTAPWGSWFRISGYFSKAMWLWFSILRTLSLIISITCLVLYILNQGTGGIDQVTGEPYHYPESIHNHQANMFVVNAETNTLKFLGQALIMYGASQFFIDACYQRQFFKIIAACASLVLTFWWMWDFVHVVIRVFGYDLFFPSFFQAQLDRSLGGGYCINATNFTVFF